MKSLCSNAGAFLFLLPFVALHKDGADWAVGILFLWLISSGQINKQAKWEKPQWRKFWLITLSVVALFVVVLLYVILKNDGLVFELSRMLKR